MNKLSDYRTIAIYMLRKYRHEISESTINDISKEMWFSEERFLNKIQGHGRVLTEEESKKLYNSIRLRAKYAVIDLIREKTHFKSSLGFIPQFIELSDFDSKINNPEDALIAKIDLERHSEGKLIKLYLTDMNMKEIAQDHNLSEGYISQRINKYIEEMSNDRS